MDFPQGPLPSPTPASPMPNNAAMPNGMPGGFPSAGLTTQAGPMPSAPMQDMSSMPQPVSIPVQNNAMPNTMPVMPPTPMTTEDQVYTMPDKFIPANPMPAAGRPKKSRKGLTIALIAIIAVAVLAIIGGIVFYVAQLANGTPTNTSTQNNVVVNRNVNSSVNANANANVSGSLNANLNANDNVNDVVNGNENVNAANTNALNTNADANTNTANINADVNTNANTNTATITAVPSKDTDADQLTNEEEKVWTTKADLPDTDGDGYNDGAEVLAGYDPANSVSSARLQNSATVGVYSNTTYAYSVIYPDAWIADTLDQGDPTEVTITPNTLDITGQFISIAVQDNPAGLTALDYYVAAAKVPESSVVTVESFSGLKGVWSTDEHSAYFADSEHVYVISYRFGTSTELFFPTTYELVVKSFKLQ